MIGNDRVRFCPECKLNVYNFSAMPEDEIQRLVARRDGRLCARWYRRADGTILTSDCPVGFRSRVKRVSKVAGAALTALLSAVPLAAQNEAKPPAPGLVQNHAANQEEETIVVKVADATGAVIPNAEVQVFNELTSETTEGETNGFGTSALDVPAGTYSVQAKASGFHVTKSKVYTLLARSQKSLTLPYNSNQP